MDKNEIKVLRSLGMNIKPTVTVGKGDVSENLIKSLDNALAANELVKIRVLNNSSEDIDDLINELKTETNSEFIEKKGHTILLYRKKEEK